MRALKRLSISLVLVLGATRALAYPVQWDIDYGPDGQSYYIAKAGYSLNIFCPDDGNSNEVAGVFLFKPGKFLLANKFTIRANGMTYEAPFDVSGRLTQKRFLSLLDSLRRSDAVVSVGNKTIVMPQSNAAEVLPDQGQKLPCNLN